MGKETSSVSMWRVRLRSANRGAGRELEIQPLLTRRHHRAPTLNPREGVCRYPVPIETWHTQIQAMQPHAALPSPQHCHHFWCRCRRGGWPQCLRLPWKWGHTLNLNQHPKFTCKSASRNMHNPPPTERDGERENKHYARNNTMRCCRALSAC